MAYLLGSETCMESLQNDIKDLQWAIIDICSRTGPLQCPSWKFPDKMSADLDIEELLEMYSFSEDEEECQVAHIALYDLVIDRSVLISILSLLFIYITSPRLDTDVPVEITEFENRWVLLSVFQKDITMEDRGPLIILLGSLP